MIQRSLFGRIGGFLFVVRILRTACVVDEAGGVAQTLAVAVALRGPTGFRCTLRGVLKSDRLKLVLASGTIEKVRKIGVPG